MVAKKDDGSDIQGSGKPTADSEAQADQADESNGAAPVKSAKSTKTAAKAEKTETAKTEKAKAAKTEKAETTKTTKTTAKTEKAPAKTAAKKTAAAKTETKKAAPKTTAKAASKSKAATKKPAAAKKAASAKPKASKKAAVSAAPFASGSLRIRLQGFDPRLVDHSIGLIVEAVKKTGVKVRGPVPLPVRKERMTVLISPHKHKDARDQYEIRTYTRILDVLSPTERTMDTLRDFTLSAGVDVSIKTDSGAR